MNNRHTRCRPYFLAVPLVVVTFTANLTAEDIVYPLVARTLVDEGDEYSLSGTITTNGALGVLSPSDIVDYTR